MAKRHRGAYTVKQVLVRDYNWRMGNLRRLFHSVASLDPDIQDMIQEAVSIQENRERERHQARLHALEQNNQSFIEKSLTIQNAIHEVERNKTS